MRVDYQTRYSASNQKETFSTDRQKSKSRTTSELLFAKSAGLQRKLPGADLSCSWLVLYHSRPLVVFLRANMRIRCCQKGGWVSIRESNHIWAGGRRWGASTSWAPTGFQARWWLSSLQILTLPRSRCHCPHCLHMETHSLGEVIYLWKWLSQVSAQDVCIQGLLLLAMPCWSLQKRVGGPWPTSPLWDRPWPNLSL